jgi:hypothetical protein
MFSRHDMINLKRKLRKRGGQLAIFAPPSGAALDKRLYLWAWTFHIRWKKRTASKTVELLT